MKPCQTGRVGGAASLRQAQSQRAPKRCSPAQSPALAETATSRCAIRAYAIAEPPTTPKDTASSHDSEFLNVNRPVRVLVAGGGIAGLVLAVALLKKGVDVRIFEQDVTAIRGEGKYRGPIQVRTALIDVAAPFACARYCTCPATGCSCSRCLAAHAATKEHMHYADLLCQRQLSAGHAGCLFKAGPSLHTMRSQTCHLRAHSQSRMKCTASSWIVPQHRGRTVLQACHCRVCPLPTTYNIYHLTLQVQSNALAALEAIDQEMAREIMAEGCVTGDRINGLCDGVSGDWYVKFDTFHPAVRNGLPVTRVISRVTLQNILAKYACNIAENDNVITSDTKIVGYEEDQVDGHDRVRNKICCLQSALHSYSTIAQHVFGAARVDGAVHRRTAQIYCVGTYRAHLAAALLRFTHDCALLRDFCQMIPIMCRCGHLTRTATGGGATSSSVPMASGAKCASSSWATPILSTVATRATRAFPTLCAPTSTLSRTVCSLATGSTL